MNEYLSPTKTLRSNSHEHIRQKFTHHRSDSSHSVDLFKLMVPVNTDSSFSSLLCPICSLPMLKPTTLPCQHTFCLKCLQNYQPIRPISLPIHSSNNDYSSHDNQPMKILTCQKCFRTHQIRSLSDLVENQSMELLINTLLCETCHQLYPSNQLDTCLHCFSVHCPHCYNDHLDGHQADVKEEKISYRNSPNDQTKSASQTNSDNQIVNTQFSRTEKSSTNETIKSNKEPEKADSSENNHPKKKSNSFLRKIINPARHRQSNSPSPKTPSSPIKPPHRPKPTIDTLFVEATKKESTVKPPITPVTPVRQFLNLFDQYTHAAQHINQCKHRQSELDNSVQKLIEVLTTKTNENLERISCYWIYIKQLILDQYEKKSERFQIFDYLLKTCCSPLDGRKQIESFIQKNDEINAAVQILTTTLTIVHDRQTLGSMNQLFDREEQTILRTLRRQFDSLMAAYTDELTFIVERMKVYESRFAAWKNSNATDLNSIAYEWTQIIEHDYPSLIEKIANDFITKIPQVEKTLVQMLRNMKKRLLTDQTPSRRTSDS